MEIKVKKEKEPELKLKKEAQVTVHKKNPILSARKRKLLLLLSRWLIF